MYRIVKKQVLNPTVTRMDIEAPLIAKKAEPGQFIILRVDEKGERIPLTVADFDRERGTVTIIFQIVGATTEKLNHLEEGDCLQDFVGPLGRPSETEGLKKVAVIGGGPAGLAAAVAAYDSGVRDILIIERESEPGGVLKQCIHNGFGLTRFKENLTGPEYAHKFIDEVNKRGIEILTDTFVTDLARDRRVTCMNESGIFTIEAGAVVLAMGCRERSKGALNIAGTRPAGLFSAGTAQKYVNIKGWLPGKRIVILGSGDIGLIMARRMTLQGAKVLACVELMPFSSGLNRNIVQCLNDYDIPLYLSHTVIDIQGKERLTGVTVAEVDERRQPIPGTEIHFDCDTLLLSARQLNWVLMQQLFDFQGGAHFIQALLVYPFAVKNIGHRNILPYSMLL